MPGKMLFGRMRPEVIEHFARDGGENWRFDYREGLGSVTAPTLVTGGALDPVTPVEVIREMADCIPNCRYVEYADAGHGVHRDTDAVFDVLREFITSSTEPR